MHNNFVREKFLEGKFCTPYDENHHKPDGFTGENTQEGWTYFFSLYIGEPG
jgi:hypothetical protein